MAGISEKEKTSLRQYRARNFQVKVEKQHYQWLYDDEVSIDITHNGSQWHGMTLNAMETVKVFEKLHKYLVNHFSYKKDLTLKKGG